MGDGIRAETPRVGAAVLVLAVVVACDQISELPSNFEDVFPEQERIVLEEPPAEPIAGITHLSATTAGGFLVTDAVTHRVLEFARSGELQRVLGRPGEGPGELDEPRAAVEGVSGEVVVVQQGSPRITTYWPNDSVSVGEVPAHYGFWLDRMGPNWIVGAATMDDRYAILSNDLAEVVGTFGAMPREVRETPFWIFLARDRAALLGETILVNHSFSPVIDVMDTLGVQRRRFGEAHVGWVEPSEPPIDRIGAPGDADRITEWSKAFTVVTGLVSNGDTIAVVQYGRHDPLDQDRNHLRHEWVDAYDLDGSKVLESLMMERRILAGGDALYVLSGEPPNGWVVTVH